MTAISRRAPAPALVLLLAGITLVLVPPGAAPAATTPSTSTTSTTTPATSPALKAPGVSLVSQSPWIATQGVEVLGLHLDDPAIAALRGAAIEITVHRSVTTRTEFDRAVSGEGLPGTRAHLLFPLSSLAVNGHGNFLIAFGVTGSAAPRSVAIDSAGVYPVEVGVVDDGGQRATFVTWMVVVDRQDSQGAQPLRVSWIWQVVTGPVQLAGNTVSRPALDEMRPGGRLDRIATLLAGAGRFPLTVGIGPETLGSWTTQSRSNTALARGVTRVRRAVVRDSVQLLPEPYVPIDGPKIEAEGLGVQVPAEYVAGSNATEHATGEIPDPRTAFVDPVDDATVSRLSQLLIGRFVVRDSAVAPVAAPLTPAKPFMLTTASGAATPTIATDSGLERLIGSDGPPALRVQRVLAGIAEIAFEAPSEARGVALAMPAGWSPDIATVMLLLRELAGDPLAQPVTLDGFFAAVGTEQRDGIPLQRTLARLPTAANLPLFESEYDAASRALVAYEAMVGRGDPSVAVGERALLLSLSTSNSREQALAQLRIIHDNLNSLTRGITTTVKTLTLTARRAELPLSFQNDTKRANIKVRVHLDSPKLIFPDGPDIVLPLPIGHSTKRVRVEARASGTFTMTVTLESADGSLELGPPTRVIIRSAAFSGIGIGLTIGALLFLAGWWGNHFRRTRRARRPAAAS